MDDLEIMMLIEVDQREKDKYYMISFINIESKKTNTNEFIYKAETDSHSTYLVFSFRKKRLKVITSGLFKIWSYRGPGD